MSKLMDNVIKQMGNIDKTTGSRVWFVAWLERTYENECSMLYEN